MKRFHSTSAPKAFTVCFRFFKLELYCFEGNPVNDTFARLNLFSINEYHKNYSPLESKGSKIKNKNIVGESERWSYEIEFLQDSTRKDR